MRATSLECVYELARVDDRIFFIGSDLGVGTLDEFKTEIPDRFFMEGISEQNVIGMAAGLALEGKIPYVNTIATFLTRRCFEQIAVDLCLHNLNVRLIGNGGGMVYAPLGPTHLATEDISLMRSLPNMTIVAPADADEMRRLMPQTVDHDGPIYIRLAKGYDPIVTNDEVPFEIGKGLHMRKGSDVLLVTTGVTLGAAQAAAEELNEFNIDCGILHMPTIKPFDTETFLDLSSMADTIITVEEHTLMGGLGSAAAEVIAEANFYTPKKFKRVGIPDVFPDEYGSQASLMEKYGISAGAIVSQVKEMVDVPLVSVV
jgi:transketolase